MFEVQVDFARSLSQVFKDLRDEYNIPELSSCKPNDCAYQKLRVPVVINDELPQETLAACSKQDNWAELNHSTRAKALTSEWKAGYVYLVIELPFGEMVPVGNELRLIHGVRRAATECHPPIKR